MVKMKKDFKNGLIINNGGNIESLPEDLFYIPNKEREEEIIKLMTKELNNDIDDKIKKIIYSS